MILRSERNNKERDKIISLIDEIIQWIGRNNVRNERKIQGVNEISCPVPGIFSSISDIISSNPCIISCVLGTISSILYIILSITNIFLLLNIISSILDIFRPFLIFFVYSLLWFRPLPELFCHWSVKIEIN